MLIAIFVIFVVLGGYFACAESAFSAMNKIRIKNLADNGNRKAKNAMYVANNFDRALTTLLIGINITHIAAASVSTLYVTRIFGDNMSEAATLACTFITTGIVFLFSEMIPKSFANDRPDTVALLTASSMIFMMKVFYPLAKVFGIISSFFSRLFKHEETPSITEEELYEIIDTAEEQGVMNEEQSDMLKSALDFDETCARDVMTMRDDIQYIDVSLSNREIIDRIKSIPHSRILVCDGTLDNVVGVLPIRKFLRAYIRDKKVNIRSVLLKPHFVKSTDNIDDLLDAMRQHKIYLGIVRDENNSVCGIVTIEDFLEELVGEIWDEEDVVEEDFIKLGGNRFLVSPSLSLGDVLERMAVDIPSDAGRAATQPVGVWVQERFGRLPEEEESFIYGNIEVIVDEVSETRVTKLVFRILDESFTSDENTDPEKPEVNV
ncbi:MAG: hemolysin family protein [Clostridiales bacterium]|nr:hemolysin family protein [Clostridiales bacterium]